MAVAMMDGHETRCSHADKGDDRGIAFVQPIIAFSGTAEGAVAVDAVCSACIEYGALGEDRCEAVPILGVEGSGSSET